MEKHHNCEKDGANNRLVASEFKQMLDQTTAIKYNLQI